MDIGTYPKDPDNPLAGFLNYDERISVEHGAFRAWGEVIYRSPLTPDQMDQYELRPSRDNPDVRRTMTEQAQVVGRWEDRNGIHTNRRLTRCIGIGAYICGDRRNWPNGIGWLRISLLFPAGDLGPKSPIKLRGDNRRKL